MKNRTNLSIITFLLFSINVLFAQKPNIVWIVSEDNSKHYLNIYNNTGVETPNIESLAENGLIFNHAFSNAPVCSAARSTLISGVYGSRLSSHYHRSIKEINMPANLNVWTRYLGEAGYHTSNDSKTDFNLSNLSAWNGGSRNKKGWRDREEGQPFFHFYTTMSSHESRLHFKDMSESVPFDIDTIFVEPRHPNTELFKYTGAIYRKRIQSMDKAVGKVVEELKKDGLYDNTFIFYFSDHGGAMPGSKGYNHETGVHVPLVVHIPENFKHLVNFEQGTRVDGFVSFVDFGVTVLNLAGVDIPDGFDGTPFLGPNVSAEQVNEQDETFSYADRFGEKCDFVRSVRKGKYKYTRNYEPFNHDGLRNDYRYKELAQREWKQLYDDGQLNAIQSRFFETKPVEMLYNIENDEYEIINLADDPAYANTLSEMRTVLESYLDKTNDLSFYPEFHLIKNAFPDPYQFGIDNASELRNLRSIADLQLLPFSEASPSLETALNSENAWERYWAIIVCSSFGKAAANFSDLIRSISTNQSEPTYNKMRSLEFLALQEGVHSNDLSIKMVKNMYNVNADLAKCILYLNSMAMLKEKLNYTFEIERNKMNDELLDNSMIKARLRYLDTPVAPSDNYLTNGIYRIINRRSGKCLVNRNNASANGTPVVQMTSDGSTDENWIIKRLSNKEFSITHQTTGLFADISRASTNRGSDNILWPDNDGLNQKWKIVHQGNGYYHIINVNSNLLLDIEGSSRQDGAQNIQWNNNGGRNQDWSFIPVSNDSKSLNINIITQNKTYTKNEFIIYPNPIGKAKLVTIKIPKKYTNGTLTITDMNGNILLNKNVTQKTMNLNLEILKQGVYFVNISNGSENISQRIILD